MSTTTRKLCLRGSAHCRPDSVKEALDCVGHHSDQPIAVIAERVGRVVGTLAKECSLYDDEHVPPLRLVVPLTLASGNDALIRYLAEACGGVFVRVPVGAGVGDVAAVAAIVQEFGEFLGEVARTTVDGRVTADELARVDHEAHDVMTAMAALVERLRHQLPGEVAPARAGRIA